MGIHARRGDLGEDMGTGGEEDQESQKEGEEEFFHGGLRLVDFGRYLKMTERGAAVFTMTAWGRMVLWGIIAWMGGFVKVWGDLGMMQKRTASPGRWGCVLA